MKSHGCTLPVERMSQGNDDYKACRTMEQSLNLQRVREHGAHIGPRDLRAPAEIKVPHPWFGVDDVGDVLNLPLAAKGVVGVRSDVLRQVRLRI